MPKLHPHPYHSGPAHDRTYPSLIEHFDQCPDNPDCPSGAPPHITFYSHNDYTGKYSNISLSSESVAAFAKEKVILPHHNDTPWPEYSQYANPIGFQPKSSHTDIPHMTYMYSKDKAIQLCPCGTDCDLTQHHGTEAVDEARRDPASVFYVTQCNT